MAQFVAVICMIICIAVIILSWKVYKDTGKIRRNVEDRDEDELLQ